MAVITRQEDFSYELCSSSTYLMIIKVTKFLISASTGHGLMAISGLLMAHWMSTQEYAIVTVFGVLVGAIAVLTKGGVNFGFTAISGRVWPDRNRISQLLIAALAERRLISLVVLPPFLLISAWMLHRNHAAWYLILVLLFFILVQWQIDMRTRILDHVLVLAGRPSHVQILDAVIAAFRLSGVVLLYFFNMLNAVTAIGIGTIIAIARVPKIAEWVNQELPVAKMEINTDDQHEIRAIVRRQLPLELFYVFQTQIVFGILAWNSAVVQTASLGALGRIGQLVVPAQAAFLAFAVTSFSTCNRRQLFRVWIRSTLIGAAPGVLLVILSLVAPDYLLLLIGQNYIHLKYELLVCSIGVATNLAVSSAWLLLVNRGWNHFAWIQVPVVITWCIVAPSLLDLTRLDHVLWFQVGFSSGLLAVVFVELYAAVKRGDMEGVHGE